MVWYLKYATERAVVIDKQVTIEADVSQKDIYDKRPESLKGAER